MGYSSNVLRAGASTNSYEYVIVENTGYLGLKVIIYNNHVSNSIDYIIDAKIDMDSDWINEVAEAALAGGAVKELTPDYLFQFYRIGIKSTVADTPSDDVDIDYCAR